MPLRGQPAVNPDDRDLIRIYLPWLNDRQPVKVLKLLNDQQSDIFSNCKEWKERIQFKLSYVYYELLSDPEELHRSQALFTPGSESETVVWAHLRFFGIFE